MTNDNGKKHIETGDDKRFEKYIAGEMSDKESGAFEEEIIGTHELSDQLYADMSLVVALETAARTKRQVVSIQKTSGRHWRPLRWAAPVAIAATIAWLVLGRGPSGPETPPIFRGAQVTPVVLVPIGKVVAPPLLFVWRNHASTAHYRFELFNASSTRLFSYVTAETTLVLDPSAVDVPGKGYWVLTPLDDLRLQSGAEVTTWYKVTP